MADGPKLTDIYVKSDFFAFHNYDVEWLEDDAFRALARIMYACMNGLAETFTPSRGSPSSWITDEGATRITRMGMRKWKRIRPKIEKFFDIKDDIWTLKPDWLEANAEGFKRPAIPAAMRSHVMQRDNFTCMYCGTKEGPFHVDHIVAVVDGGATHEDNLICACAQCNLSKKDKDADAWVAENVVPIRGDRRG